MEDSEGTPSLQQLTQGMKLNPKATKLAETLYDLGLEQYNHPVNNRDRIVHESRKIMAELASILQEKSPDLDQLKLADEIGRTAASAEHERDESQWRATILARLTGWRWRIQGGVQTQSGDQGNGFTEGLAAVEQIQHGIAVVAHQHQGSVGQPAAQLHDHLAGPVGELLVLASLLLVVTGRRRQHREHRQGPMASGPGHVAQTT